MKTRNLTRGAAAGFLAGLAAGAAMSVFSAAWFRVLPGSRGRPLQYPPPEDPAPSTAASSPLAASQQEWDSTESAAVSVAHRVLARRLAPRQRVWGAVAAHFAVSAAAGAVYGAAAELLPAVAAGSGLIFGAGLWLTAQEVLMPALGWSRPLPQYSLAMQANSLGEHLAYGIATDGLRRALRHCL